jgi:hypothetical protein
MYAGCIRGIDMCGIMGLVSYSGAAPSHLQARMLHKATTRLLKVSEIRGRDAAGLSILTDKKLSLFKTDLMASKFVQTAKYSDIMKEINRYDVFKAMIGHTRAKTKGHQRFNINNHPIMANRIVGVHNGFICNDDDLFGKYSAHIDRKGEVDSEIIFRLIDFHRREGESIVQSIQKTCSDISGSYTCAFLDAEEPSYVTVFSNSSMTNAYILVYEAVKTIVFASSEYILNNALKDNSVLDTAFATHKIEVGRAGFRIDVRTGRIYKFDIGEKKAIAPANAMQRSLLGIPEGGGCSLEETGFYHDMLGHCDRHCAACPYYRY